MRDYTDKPPMWLVYIGDLLCIAYFWGTVAYFAAANRPGGVLRVYIGLAVFGTAALLGVTFWRLRRRRVRGL